MASMLPPAVKPKADVWDVVNMFGDGLKIVHMDTTGKNLDGSTMTAEERVAAYKTANDLGGKIGLHIHTAVVRVYVCGGARDRVSPYFYGHMAIKVGYAQYANSGLSERHGPGRRRLVD
jgi:hypothetical protein